MRIFNPTTSSGGAGGETGATGATGPQGAAGQSSSFFNYQAKQNGGFPPGSNITTGHIV